MSTPQARPLAGRPPGEGVRALVVLFVRTRKPDLHQAPVSSSMRGIATRTEATPRAVVSPDMCLRPVETFSVAALADGVAMIDHDAAPGSAVPGSPASDHLGVAAPVHICPPILESHRVRASSLAWFQH